MTGAQNHRGRLQGAAHLSYDAPCIVRITSVRSTRRIGDAVATIAISTSVTAHAIIGMTRNTISRPGIIGLRYMLSRTR